MILEDTIRAILLSKREPISFGILACEIEAHWLTKGTSLYTLHDVVNQMLSECTIKLTKDGRYTLNV